MNLYIIMPVFYPNSCVYNVNIAAPATDSFTKRYPLENKIHFNLLQQQQ